MLLKIYFKVDQTYRNSEIDRALTETENQLHNNATFAENMEAYLHFGKVRERLTEVERRLKTIDPNSYQQLANLFEMPDNRGSNANTQMLIRLQEVCIQARDLRLLNNRYRRGEMVSSAECSEDETTHERPEIYNRNRVQVSNVVNDNVVVEREAAQPNTRDMACSPIAEFVAEDTPSLSGLGENEEEGAVAMAPVLPPARQIPANMPYLRPSRPASNRVIGVREMKIQGEFKSINVIESPLALDNYYMPRREVLVGNSDARVSSSILDPDVSQCLRLLPLHSEDLRYRASRPVIHDREGRQYHLAATPLPYTGQYDVTLPGDLTNPFLYRTTMRHHPQIANTRDVRSGKTFVSTRLVRVVDACTQAPVGADGVIMTARCT